MMDARLIRSKLDSCSLYLSRLQPLSQTPYRTFSSDYVVSSAAERLVQLIVDAAVDVNNHLSSIVSGLPTDGATVLVRLWWRTGDTWASFSNADYPFTAAPQ